MRHFVMAIFEAGMTTIKKEEEIAGYAEIASTQSASEARKRRAHSRRRRPTWAEEA